MRFGIIGTNFVTDWLLQAGACCPDFELTTVYSRTPERARQYADQYGAPFCCTSIESLAESANVDAVYIASPTALHHAHAKAMLLAGKHVLCEKPVTSNLQELQELIELAQSRGLVLLEAIRPAFLPALVRLQELLEEIGPVRRAVLSFCKYSSRYDRFLSGEPVNAFNPALSNGALMDLGVYCIHVLLRLFGMPQSTQSACVKLHNSIDASGTILASYEGMTAELLYSKVSDSHNACEIQGEKGSIYFNQISTLQEISVIMRGEKQPTPVVTAMHENDMLYELSTFIRLAQSNGDPSAYWNDSLNAMRLMDLTRKQCGIVFPSDHP